jgi:uncharacterized protein DUF2442
VTHPNNHPIALKIRDGMVWVTLKDMRVIGAPIRWFPWLANASPEQQANFELHAFSIYWPDLDDGLDIEAMLTGNWTTPMDESQPQPEYQ